MFDRLVVPWRFVGPVQSLLHGLKYEGRTFVAPVVAAAVAGRLTASGVDLTDRLIVPVPLHNARLRERGYNQSQLLASELSRRLGLQTVNVLKRVRATETQTALGLKERVSNVSGAFVVKRPEKVCERRVLLIDDVCTTGATLNACTEALIEAGAVTVTAVAAASPYR